MKNFSRAGIRNWKGFLGSLFFIMAIFCGGTIHAQNSRNTKKMKNSDFKKLLETVADGWNRGDALQAADCFTEDARYTEPPDKQVYIGRDALFEFFGGNQKPAPTMSMTWHHIAFDEENQIGFGEYTFQGRNRYHGIVIIKVVSGKIANWREYQYKSDLDWNRFTEKNPF